MKILQVRDLLDKSKRERRREGCVRPYTRITPDLDLLMRLNM